jgi:ABC-2 type transport system permease protein
VARLLSIIPLVQNELMKVVRRRRTWVMITILFMAEVFLTIILRKMAGLDASDDMWGFILTSSELMSMIQIFTVIIAGDIVASEFTWGTIKLLLIRPENRSTILLSKFIAVFIFAIVLIILLFFSSLVLGVIVFGTKTATPQILQQLVNIGEEYVIRFVEMGMAATFAFMLSTVFRSSSLAIGLSIFLMFTGNTVVELLRHFNFNWAKYILFANTDLSQYMAGREPLFNGMTLGFSIAVMLTYFLIFLLLAWAAFTKRDVSV